MIVQIWRNTHVAGAFARTIVSISAATTRAVHLSIRTVLKRPVTKGVRALVVWFTRRGYDQTIPVECRTADFVRFAALRSIIATQAVDTAEIQVEFAGAVRVGRVRAVGARAHVQSSGDLARAAVVGARCAAHHLCRIVWITAAHGLGLWIRITIHCAIQESVLLRSTRRHGNRGALVAVIAKVDNRTIWIRRRRTTQRAFVATFFTAAHSIEVFSAWNGDVGFQAIRRWLETLDGMHVIDAGRVPNFRNEAAMLPVLALMFSNRIAIVGAVNETVDADVIMLAVGAFAAELIPLAFGSGAVTYIV